MYKSSFHILRVGIGITFLWMGVLIFKDPSHFREITGLSLFFVNILMYFVAWIDIVIGLLLLVDWHVKFVSLFAMIELLFVFILIGINNITVRDIGLFAIVFVLFLETLPEEYLKKKNIRL